MTILTDEGDQGSFLPPSKRDVTNLDQVVRQHARNLRNIAQGFGGGRIVGARLVPSGSQQAEDATAADGDPADDAGHAWEWSDRHTVIATGTQSITLSHVPIDESLFVLWHPAGGAGVPLTNELFNEADGVVTIGDPGFLALGDQFSFQYEFDPTDVDAPDVDEAQLPPLVVRDTTSTSTVGEFPVLPPLTEVGDLIVVACEYGGLITCTDPRLTKLTAPGDFGALYIGNASDLSPLSFTGTVHKAVVATFVGVGAAVAGALSTDPTTAATAPQVPGYAAIGAVWTSSSVVPGHGQIDAPFVFAVDSSSGGGGDAHNRCSIHYWYDAAATTTPAAPCSWTGAVVSAQVTVVSLGTS